MESGKKVAKAFMKRIFDSLGRGRCWGTAILCMALLSACPSREPNTIVLINESRFPIDQFFIAGPGTIGAGRDYVEEVLEPGGEISVSGFGAGRYELTVRFLQGDGTNRQPVTRAVTLGNGGTVRWYFNLGEKALLVEEEL